MSNVENSYDYWSTVRKHDISSVQTSEGQMLVIASALALYNRKANFLVFGCGNDSPIWHDLNVDGYTLFVENQKQWLSKTAAQFPHLNIEQIDYYDRTVATSLPMKEAEMATYDVPAVLKQKQWDVILVDSPAGHKPDRPGRSLSIYWASQIAIDGTQLFVDDYNRKLEKTYADHFIRSKRTFSLEVPRTLSRGVASPGMMLWSIGIRNRET